MGKKYKVNINKKPHNKSYEVFVNLEGLSSNRLIQDLNWILKLNI